MAGSDRSAETLALLRRRSPGISLMEVLMAIAVVAIGLLGVAALMPLAYHKASEGVTEDRKGAAGLQAFQEARIRGMHRPDQWMRGNGSTAAHTYTLSGDDPFCIDPRQCAMTNSNKFPQSGPMSMDRISLRSEPNGVKMPLIQANEVFVIQDDLVFEIPDNQNLPPTQIYFPTGWKRHSDGHFSWLATVVPDLNYDSDMYVLSVAVIHQRVLNTDSEKWADVTFYGGGDVQLSGGSGAAATIREGEWIMLGQANPNGNVFKWFRVIGADNNRNQTTREFTLQGPDWNNTVATNAIYLPGVVAVYEKTIRLETSSLWTN